MILDQYRPLPPSENLLSLVNQFMLTYEFYTILVSGNEGDCLKDLGLPMIQVDWPVNFELIKTSINQQVLSIVFLDEQDFRIVIRSLSDFLLHNKESKVVLVTDTQNPSTIQEILELCWQHVLLNTVVFQRSTSKIFAYKPFPSFEVFERTSDIFAEKIRDVYGSVLTYAMVYDAPKKFKYFYKNLRYCGGYAWHVFEEFAKSINLTIYEKYDYDELNKDAFVILDLLSNGSIEFSPIIGLGKVDKQSYFMEYLTNYQVVPIITNVEKLWYLLGLFSSGSWLGVLFVISFYTVLLSVANKVFYKKYDIISNFRASSKIMLLQQPLSPNVFKRNIRGFFILLLFTDMIVSTTYLSLLGTFLTKSKEIAQINSFSDLKSHNLKVMLSREEIIKVKEGLLPPPIPKKYMDEAFLVSYSELIEHHKSLNTSFAYVMSSDKWKMFYKAQEFRNHFIFRIMEAKDSRSFRAASLPFGRTSLYRSAFDRFLTTAYSTGLIVKWETDAVFEMAKGKLLFDMPKIDTPGPKPLSLEYFHFPLFLIGLTFVLSSGILVIEKVVAHRGKKRKVVVTFYLR